MVPTTRQSQPPPASTNQVDHDLPQVRTAVVDRIGSPTRQHPRYSLGHDFFCRVGITNHQPSYALDPRQLDTKHLQKLGIRARQPRHVMTIDNRTNKFVDTPLEHRHHRKVAGRDCGSYALPIVTDESIAETGGSANPGPLDLRGEESMCLPRRITEGRSRDVRQLTTTRYARRRSAKS